MTEPIQQLPRPDGHRADAPGRAGLRPLLPAPQGAHHLPRHADRRHVANLIIAQLLHLESEDPDKDICIYINSPGGEITGLFAIYDTMQYIKPDVRTICIGQAASAAAVLLAAGAHGKRFVLPHARILIHQPHGGASGQAVDIEIQAKEIMRMRSSSTRSSPTTPARRSSRSTRTPTATSS